MGMDGNSGSGAPSKHARAESINQLSGEIPESNAPPRDSKTASGSTPSQDTADQHDPILALEFNAAVTKFFDDAVPEVVTNRAEFARARSAVDESLRPVPPRPTDKSVHILGNDHKGALSKADRATIARKVAEHRQMDSLFLVAPSDIRVARRYDQIKRNTIILASTAAVTALAGVGIFVNATSSDGGDGGSVTPGTTASAAPRDATPAAPPTTTPEVAELSNEQKAALRTANDAGDLWQAIRFDYDTIDPLDPDASQRSATLRQAADELGGAPLVNDLIADDGVIHRVFDASAQVDLVPIQPMVAPEAYLFRCFVETKLGTPLEKYTPDQVKAELIRTKVNDDFRTVVLRNEFDSEGNCAPGSGEALNDAVALKAFRADPNAKEYTDNPLLNK